MNPLPALVFSAAVLLAALVGISFWWGHRSARKRLLKCVFVRMRYKDSRDMLVFAQGPFECEKEMQKEWFRVLGFMFNDKTTVQLTAEDWAKVKTEGAGHIVPF